MLVKFERLNIEALIFFGIDFSLALIPDYPFNFLPQCLKNKLKPYKLYPATNVFSSNQFMECFLNEPVI